MRPCPPSIKPPAQPRINLLLASTRRSLTEWSKRSKRKGAICSSTEGPKRVHIDNATAKNPLSIAFASITFQHCTLFLRIQPYKKSGFSPYCFLLRIMQKHCQRATTVFRAPLNLIGSEEAISLLDLSCLSLVTASTPICRIKTASCPSRYQIITLCAWFTTAPTLTLAMSFKFLQTDPQLIRRKLLDCKTNSEFLFQKFRNLCWERG